MERKKINEILRLSAWQNQLNDLAEVLCSNEPTKITISNNKGISKNFDGNMIDELRKHHSDMMKELNQQFADL